MQNEPAGDADIAATAALFADPTRARVLAALADGRALPASVLAAEAGVSAQAASGQLAKLREAGLLTVERSGRHRYYRLSSARIANALEVLAELAPARPVRSLREGTRAAALRTARTCYDHLAGRLGVKITGALLECRALVAGDGIADTVRRPADELAKPLPAHPYALGPAAEEVFGSLGIGAERLHARTGRPLLRFCVDWSEQRHHLAGRLGAELLGALEGAGWVRRQPGRRAVRLTEPGATALHERLGVRLES